MDTLLLIVELGYLLSHLEVDVMVCHWVKLHEW